LTSGQDTLCRDDGGRKGAGASVKKISQSSERRFGKGEGGGRESLTHTRGGTNRKAPLLELE